MIPKYFQIDLDERNKINLSKRYRGFNRIYQINIAKYLNNDPQNKLNFIVSQQSKNQQGQYSMIIVKSKNAPIYIKQVNSQAYFQNKKFYKRKLVRQYLSGKTSQNFEQNKPEAENSQKITISNPYQSKLKKGASTSINRQKIIRNKLNPQKHQQQSDSKIFIPLFVKSQKKKINEGVNKQQKTEGINQSPRKNHRKDNYSQYQKYSNPKSPIGCQNKKQQFEQFYDKTRKLQKIYQKNQAKSSSKISIFPDINKQKTSLKAKNYSILAKNQAQLKHIRSESFVIVQMQSQNIVVSQKASTPYQIASLTKIMTFYVILETVKKFNINIQKEQVKVIECVYDIGGTSAQICAGQTYKLYQLLFGLMLPSGNDAAVTLASWAGQYYVQTQNLQIKIKTFVSQMNKLAKQIGLIQTRFANPHGLPNFQSRSTAYQVAKLCCLCLKQQVFRIVVSTQNFRCETRNQKGEKRINQWVNTHKLLRRQGFIGIKTGITVTAGPCLASAYTFRQKTYICVLLRSTKVSRRFKQTRKLLGWALQKLYEKDLNEKQRETLKKLKKNRPQFDSDSSQDEPQFKYQKLGQSEYKKRCNIISDM